MPYQLIYRYKHCTGDYEIPRGTVETLEEARKWVSQGSAADADEPAAFDTTGAACPASFCAFKTQRPVRAFREVP